MPERPDAAQPTYEVQIDPLAWREIMALPERDQERIFYAIEALENDPRPRGAIKVKSRRGIMRRRVGRYRVFYSVEDRALVVLVVEVTQRKDAYR